MSEPTLGEALRRLDDVSRKMDALGDRMHSDRQESAATFVRRDVYAGESRTLDARVTDIEEEAEERARTSLAFRRQIALGLFLIAVPMIATLLLAVSNFLARLGG